MISSGRNRFAHRQYAVIIIVIAVVVIYLIRLFNMQVLSPEYQIAAEDIAYLKKTLYPSRGMIYDHEGRLVVFNNATADVHFISREVLPFDTLEFCKIVGITPIELQTLFEEIRDRSRNKGYSPYTPQLLLSQISEEEAGLLEERLYKYPGFYVVHRTIRDYKYPSSGLMLGYMSEVSPRDIERDPYYRPGEQIGRSGIEYSYERFLRGKKGKEVYMRDAHGRVKGRRDDSELNEDLTTGHDLTLSVDIELQMYGEKLLKGKRGAIVMIEPKSGEVRALVSSPSYDPKLLVGRDRGEHFKALEQNPEIPLFNRAIMGTYPPGSTFKPAQAAVFLQSGAIKPTDSYPCSHGYPVLGGRPACHGHSSPLSVVPALATSCNAFFCYGLRNLIDDRSRYPSTAEAFEAWKNYIVKLGYGYPLGLDLPGEKRGFIPNANLYNKIYGEGQWRSSTIISISIGQGEILVTPLQLANFAATVANKGYYYTPHLVSKISDLPSDSLYIERHETGILPEYFQYVDQGMRGAVTGGTCRKAELPGIKVCGKTGTAENSHGKDHSLFIGYAPQEDPQIAIAVIVENGGFGANYGVPIGRLMIEYYLNNYELSTESQVYETQMLNSVIY